jgi:hypothetical protein
VTEERDGLREALKHTAVALKGSEVAFALGGGYAAWALGGPEPEHDVDFVVADQDRARAMRVLEDAGLRVETPPEDWLFKVFHDGAMVDVIHRIGGEPVDPELLDRAVETEVLSIRMPVLSATDLVAGKLLALSEHACDYGKVLPAARSLREQVEWDALRSRVAGNPYAEAFLVLVQHLGVAPG